MPDDKQTWKIAATPRQRWVFLQSILLREETPRARGAHSIRVRDRLRRALGLNQILTAIGAANALGQKGMPMIDDAKLTDIPSAFTVTVENADELEVILKPPKDENKSGVELGDYDQVLLATVLTGLLDRVPCDPEVPAFDYSAPDDWTTPIDWRERRKAKAPTPESGQAQCPNCSHCFVPVE